MGRELSLIINSLIKWGIFFGILYLIFTNFGTFLIILFVLIAFVYYLVYKFKKKIKEQQTGGFRFTFNGHDFSQAQSGGQRYSNFNFRDFEEQFRQGNFQNGSANLGEVSKAKEFFGFTSDPTKDDIKRKYKELARKYHPDINNDGDELMKQLNHYKDILLRAFPN